MSLALQQDFFPGESLKNFWVLVKLMLEDRNTFCGKDSSSGGLKLETGVIDFDLDCGTLLSLESCRGLTLGSLRQTFVAYTFSVTKFDELFRVEALPKALCALFDGTRPPNDMGVSLSTV